MKTALLLVVFLAVFVLLAWNSIFAGPYFYDEADYMSATALGPVVNAFDSGSMPIPEFIRLGLDRGKDPAQKTVLSQAVRNPSDVVFFRHWHGPLLYYFMMPLEALHASEQVVRASMLFFPIISLVITYFGTLWVLPASQRQLGAVVTAALVFWNFAAVKSSEVAPHQLYATAFICSLLLLAKTIATGERKYWYLSLVAAALAFAALEVAFILVFTILVVGWIERKALRADLAFALKSIAVFVASVFVVWPGAILKLSFLKAYFFLAYLSLFRKAAWGEITLADAWRTRLLDNALDWILLVLCLVAYFALRRLETRRLVYPFLMYGVLMLLMVSRIATYSPRYVLPFMQAFDLFIGFTLASLIARLPAPRQWPVVGAFCLLVASVSWLEMRAHPIYPEYRLPAVIASVRDHGLQNASLLVPQPDLPTVHFYFPRAQLRGYRDQTPSPEDAASGRFDAILYTGLPVRIEVAGQIQPRAQ